MNNDFADWLSPILVKELRQGIRSRTFISIFLIVQGLMMFNTIIGLFGASNTDADQASTGIFWTMLGLPLLLFMPLAGLTTVSKETGSNTLELIFLTRLNARRILFGKWIALVAQTALLVSAVLPYLVLRYFSGGVNLAQEVEVVAWMFLGSAVLTSLTVGASPFQAKLVARVIIVAGIVLTLYTVPSFFTYRTMGPRRATFSPYYWSGVAAILTGAFLFIQLALEIGAARIAPPAENHSTRKRLLVLGITLVISFYGFITAETGAFVTVAAFFFAVASIGAVCELPSTIPTVYHPFVKHGFFGRLSMVFLSPGWPSAVIYTASVLAAMFTILTCSSNSPLFGSVDYLRITLVFVSLTGSLYFPVALARLFTPKTSKGIVYFLAILSLSAVVFACAMILDKSINTDFAEFTSLLPACGLLFSLEDSTGGSSLALLLALFTTTGSFLVLLLLMPKRWREIIAIAGESRKRLEDKAGHAA